MAKSKGSPPKRLATRTSATWKCIEKHGVNYLKYWFNEESGRVYCLVDAPNMEAAIAVHQEAHGLVADELTEVQEGS